MTQNKHNYLCICTQLVLMFGTYQLITRIANNLLYTLSPIGQWERRVLVMIAGISHKYLYEGKRP